MLRTGCVVICALLVDLSNKGGESGRTTSFSLTPSTRFAESSSRHAKACAYVAAILTLASSSDSLAPLMSSSCEGRVKLSRMPSARAGE